MGSVLTESPKPTTLDLRKKMVLDLKKEKGLEGQLAQVVACYDRSGSLDWAYNNGVMQRLTERILPVGLGFDDNGVVDLFIFHNNAWRSKVDITVNTVNQVIPEIKRHSSGGTSYAPAIKLILDEYVGAPTGGGFFSKAARPLKKFDYPVFVLYFTDGANDDKSETEEVIREASKYGIYFQFIGIGNASMPFLEKLDDLSGRNIDNCGFFRAKDIDGMSDQDLYNSMMKEFPAFVTEARSKGYIK